ncbi:MAG: hypothetical protein FJ290_17140 [Planctomycetes bacterium]|nr:hypothetical protein [Planctomycetota bacterium]
MEIARWAIIVFGVLEATGSIAAVQGPPKKPRVSLPSDEERRHEATVASGRHEYVVAFKGAVDGVMTRMAVSYGAFHQGWQPNLSARIENVGETDVVNPWLTVNGLGDWRTVQKIAEEATRGCQTDADKARAIWEWERHHRFHATTWDGEVSDAVKAHNVYGYTLCGDDACVIADLFRAAGLQVRSGHPVGHCVVEAFYDGGYHLLDGDEHVICLLRDNRAIASEAEVVRDHDLMKRTHTYSIGAGENPLTDQFSASLYGYEGERKPGFRNSTSHTMFFTLRPGESLEWRWDHVGKEYSAGADIEPGKRWSRDGEGQLRSGWGETAHDNLRNGKWLYRPPLDKALYRRGIVAEENVACSADDGLKPNLRPKQPGQPAKVAWKIGSPYVIVGGTIKCEFKSAAEADTFRLSWSPDGKTWQEVSGTHSAANVSPLKRRGQVDEAVNIDKLLSPRRKPMYAYFVQAEMNGKGVGLDSIVFDSDVQMSLLGMPELTVGENRLCYTDETKGERKVQITHAWLERRGWQPPRAPETAVFPQDGATVEGTRFALKWSPAAADQGTAIADYHVQVCEREDMRWVLSPNFDKLTSLTPSKGKPEWAIPFTGLLNPDTTYYWRVRAKDSRGVWGAWSRRFSFRCAAPGVPLNLRAAPDAEKATVEITWEDNPQGCKPVRYKVHGSDEKGFTASDAEHIVRMGHGLCDTMEEFKARKQGDPFFGDVKTPANLIAETKERRLTIAANRAFYRVVAVDEKGNESGPSDYGEFPRPFIFGKPPTTAKVGQPFRYEAAAVASIGHLTCKDGYNAAFWGREKLTWMLEAGPAWLKLEGSHLAGTPGDGDAGPHPVSLKVANNKGGQAQQKFVVVVQK